MMHCLCRRSRFELSRRLFVTEDVLQQTVAAMGLRNSATNPISSPNIFSTSKPGRRKILAEIDLLRLAGTHPMDGDLQVVAVRVDQTPDKDDIVPVEGVDRVLEVVPPLAHDLPGSIGEQDQGKLPACLLGS
jgi:hypothetical protein